ncbi:hypothetical protein CS022_24860, partial [Veronia nyctiphanis]
MQGDVTLPAGETQVTVYLLPKDDNVFETNTNIGFDVSYNGMTLRADGDKEATVNDDADAPSIASVSNVTVT